MENWMIILGVISLLLCALPTSVYAGNKKTKLIIFVLAFVSIVFSFLAIINFNFLRFSNIEYFVIPLGPVILTILALNKRNGVFRKVGYGLVTFICVLLIYLIIGLLVTKSNDAFDAVIHVPSFLKGQKIVKFSMNDPDSAVFRKLFLNTYRGTKMMCGEVNGRNRMGGYVGYTRFYVNLDDDMSTPFFDDNADGDTFNTYMTVCHGDNWSEPN